MNTYYLKKFRKEAWEEYGIIKDNGRYVVQYRRSGVWCFRGIHVSLETALEYLHERRNEYILELVKSHRGSDDKENKELSKL